MTGFLQRLLGGSEHPPGDGPDNGYRVRLVVGLGNPGEEYAQTRRNIGFWTANRLARKHGMEFSTKTNSYLLAEGTIAGHAVAIAKPRTFVNGSGTAVMALIRRLKLDHAKELLVVCDHLDLPGGKVRIRRKGGAGGQKGLTHIIDVTHTDEFPRVRIGIGRPVVQGQPSWEPDDVAGYVLSDPTTDEREVLDTGVARAIEAIECAITDGVETAMNRYNRDE